jgi:hypothetical protein
MMHATASQNQIIATDVRTSDANVRVSTRLEAAHESLMRTLASLGVPPRGDDDRAAACDDRAVCTRLKSR